MSEHTKLFIPLVLGTPREGRRSEVVASYLMRVLQGRDDVESQLVDVAELDLSPRGPNRKSPPPSWRAAAARADGFLIVTPEYNHGYPGGLKNALDVLYDEYFRKAVGVCGVSAGILGATRAIQGLLPVFRGLGLVTIRRDLHVPGIRGAFDEAGEPTDAKASARAEAFIDDLVWMARALRDARERTAAV